MKEFSILFRFNFRRIISTWMVRILAILVIGGTLFGLLVLHKTETRETVTVSFTGENYSAYKDAVLAILNKSSDSYVYTTEKKEKNILKLKINQIDNMLDIKASAVPSDCFDDQQSAVVQMSLQNAIISDAGVSYPKVRVENTTIDEVSESKDTVFLIVLLGFYILILVSGNIITSSIALEKTSKVSDLLTYRVSIMKIIYSKVAALYAVLLLMIAAAIVEIGISLATGFINMDSVKHMLETASLSGRDIVAVFVCILAGLVVYTILYVITGTMVKAPEQIQYSQLPAASVTLISFAVTILSRNNPSSVLAKICSYLPVSSPFLGICTLFHGQLKLMQVSIAACILVVFVVLGNMIAVRLYRLQNA